MPQHFEEGEKDVCCDKKSCKIRAKPRISAGVFLPGRSSSRKQALPGKPVHAGRPRMHTDSIRSLGGDSEITIQGRSCGVRIRKS
jgi:hypothetical protein